MESFACCKRDYEITPQSACGCQLSTRHALRVPFQGSLKKASLEKGGGPAKLVEGFFCKIFCIMFQVIRKNPSVSLRLPAPFSREPIHQKGA